MAGNRPTIEKFKRDNARRLRANATGAEDKLWRQLRRLPMQGSHFRRQVPIGPYIADFACMSARLIIEVDGSQHGSSDGAARDSQRTEWLAARGYRVIRFWNNDINGNSDEVLAAIHAALYGSPDAEPVKLKHRRLRKSRNQRTPPRRASRADPPLPGEGD